MLQPRQTEKPAVGVVLDTSLSRIDDVLSMALLYGLDGKKEERLVSVSVSRANLKAAIYSDVVGRFYAGAVSGAIGFGGRTLPVGLAEVSPLKADLPFFTKPLERMTLDGKPAYPSDIHEDLDTAEVPAMVRNALTAQWDGNTIVIVNGPATDIAKVLATGNSKDWIEKKVSLLVFVGGRFPSGTHDSTADENIKTDIAAAKSLFAGWPTPIVVCGAEMDGLVSYPGASIEKDFAWSPAHPVVDAYRAAGTMPYDAPVWAMHAGLYAIRPKEGYFKVSDPGTISVQDDGRTTFTPSANGKHRHLIFDPAQKDRLIKTYTEIVSAKPVPKPERSFPPKNALQQQKQAPPPPAEKKP